MRFFLYGTYIPADQLLPVARAAERLGFDGITLPDHVVYPMEYGTSYPYKGDPVTGLAPWGERCEWLDPFVAASSVLTGTERLIVLTGIFVLPMRDPLLVAKSVATLDALTPGRFILGAGAGWLREEFDILGFDFESRGPRSDEAIEVLRKLWSGGPVAHQGRFFSFPELVMAPAPPTRVPIYVGGDAPPALRRAARLGDGLLPPLSSRRKTPEHLELIKRLREEAGREEPFDYVASAVGIREPEGIAQLGELGVASVHVDPFQLYYRPYGGLSGPERHEALERYAAEVIAPLRSRG